jgi:hypothetical protein
MRGVVIYEDIYPEFPIGESAFFTVCLELFSQVLLRVIPREMYTFNFNRGDELLHAFYKANVEPLR